MSTKIKEMFASEKEEVDRLFASVFDPNISLDFFNLYVKLPTNIQQVDISALFTYISKLGNINRLEYSQSSSQSAGPSGSKNKQQVTRGTLSTSIVVACENRTPSFQEDALKKYPAYIYVPPSGNDGPSTSANAHHTSDGSRRTVYVDPNFQKEKYSILGLHSEYHRQGGHGTTINTNIYVYRTGTVRLSLGIRHDKRDSTAHTMVNNGNDNMNQNSSTRISKHIPKPSRLITDIDAIFYTLAAEVYWTFFEGVLIPFFRTFGKLNPADFYSCITADKIGLWNMSSVCYLRRPWTFPEWSAPYFKTNTSIIMEDYIQHVFNEDHMPPEYGTVITTRHDRSTEEKGPSFFMLNIHHCIYSSIFSPLATVAVDFTHEANMNSQLHRLVIRNAKLSADNWKINDSLSARDKKAFFDSVHSKVYFDKKRSSLVVPGFLPQGDVSQTSRTISATLIQDSIPKVAVKVYQNGTLQLSGLTDKSPHPWYTYWLTINMLTRSFLSQGVSKSIPKELMAQNWLVRYIEGHHTLVSPDKNVNSKNGPSKAGLKDVYQRRGRKPESRPEPKSSSDTTYSGGRNKCLPASRIPNPEHSYEGSCKDATLIVRPNKHGVPCCLKPPKIIDLQSWKKIKKEYGDVQVPVPSKVRQLFQGIMNQASINTANTNNKRSNSGHEQTLLDNVNAQLHNNNSTKPETYSAALLATCKPNWRLPNPPSLVHGRCSKPGYIVKKNKHGAPCCFKASSSDETSQETLNHTNKQATMDVTIGLTSGKLKINNKTSLLLDDIIPVAQMLHVPLEETIRRAKRKRTAKQLKRDILARIIISQGMPTFDPAYEKKALQNLAIALFLPLESSKRNSSINTEQQRRKTQSNSNGSNSNTEIPSPKSSYKYIDEIMQDSRKGLRKRITKLIDYIRRTEGIQISADNKSLTSVPLIIGPDTNKHPTSTLVNTATKSNNNNGNIGLFRHMSEEDAQKRKLLLSLDALFGFISEDL